jgi:hypothetical protein
MFLVKIDDQMSGLKNICLKELMNLLKEMKNYWRKKMKTEIRIVIPNIDCMIDEERHDLENFLRRNSIGYEYQDITFRQEGG